MCGKRVAEGVGMNGLTLNINSDDLRELVSSSMESPQLCSKQYVFYRNLSNIITKERDSQR